MLAGPSVAWQKMDLVAGKDDNLDKVRPFALHEFWAYAA